MFKTGYDKFITVRMLTTVNKPCLSFILSEWKPFTTGGWEKTAKTIALKLHTSSTDYLAFSCQEQLMSMRRV